MANLLFEKNGGTFKSTCCACCMHEIILCCYLTCKMVFAVVHPHQRPLLAIYYDDFVIVDACPIILVDVHFFLSIIFIHGCGRYITESYDGDGDDDHDEASKMHPEKKMWNRKLLCCLPSWLLPCGLISYSKQLWNKDFCTGVIYRKEWIRLPRYLSVVGTYLTSHHLTFPNYDRVDHHDMQLVIMVRAPVLSFLLR